VSATGNARWTPSCRRSPAGWTCTGYGCWSSLPDSRAMGRHGAAAAATRRRAAKRHARRPTHGGVAARKMRSCDLGVSCGARRCSFPGFAALPAEVRSIRRVLVSRFRWRGRPTGRLKCLVGSAADERTDQRSASAKFLHGAPKSWGFGSRSANSRAGSAEASQSRATVVGGVRCRCGLSSHRGPSRRARMGRRTDHQQHPVSQQRSLTSEYRRRYVGLRFVRLPRRWCAVAFGAMVSLGPRKP
jgi:hypothetical protein